MWQSSTAHVCVTSHQPGTQHFVLWVLAVEAGLLEGASHKHVYARAACTPAPALARQTEVLQYSGTGQQANSGNNNEYHSLLGENMNQLQAMPIRHQYERTMNEWTLNPCDTIHVEPIQDFTGGTQPPGWPQDSVCTLFETCK